MFYLTAKLAGKSSSDNKFRGANIGPTWVLSAPDGPHVGPMNLAIRVINHLEFTLQQSDLPLDGMVGLFQNYKI